MNFMQIPTVDTMRKSMPVKPSEYTIPAKPTPEQVKKLVRAIKKNLDGFPCLIPLPANTGWKFIMMTQQQWKEACYETLNIDLTDPAAIIAADNDTRIAVPDAPVITNPYLFIIDSAWTEKQITIERENYNQKVYVYMTADNLEQAILQDLKEAIPSSITTDLTIEGGDFKANMTILKVIDHLETTFDKLEAADLRRINLEFDKPYDGTETIGIYWQKQDTVVKLLKNIKGESISPEKCISTALACFETVAHTTGVCKEWKEDVEDGIITSTWANFKTYFNKKMHEYEYRTERLGTMGMANSAISSTHLNAITDRVTDSASQLQNLMSAEFGQRDNDFDDLKRQVALLAQTITSNSPPTTILTSAHSTTSDFGIANSIAALAKQVEILSNNNNNTNNNNNNNGGRGNNNNKNNNNSSSWATKNRKFTRNQRLFNNTNYCWTHGCDVAPKHTSETCKMTGTGHIKTATINNRMGGSSLYCNLVGNPTSTS